MKLACTMPKEYDAQIELLKEKLKLPNNNQLLIFALHNLIERMDIK